MSNKLRINCWRLYKVSTDVNRQLVVLSAHVLSAFNAYMSEADIKKSFDVNWMSVKLKEEIAVVLWVKLTFIQIIKNQSVRNQEIT